MGLRTGSFLSILVLVMGCRPPEVVPDAGDQPMDAAVADVDAGPDAGTAVDAGLDASVVDAGPVYDAGPTECPTCNTLSWVTSGTSSRPRNHHFSCIVEVDAGTFLFAMGGVELDGVLNDVDQYSLAANGEIFATDASVPPMLVAAGGMSGAVVSNTIVLAGGMTSTRVTNSAYRATVQADGSLSAWQATGNTLHQRMHSGAFSIGNDMYVIGGFNHPTVWDDVVKTTKQPDGTFSPWTTVGTMPGPRSHFSITRIDRFVYLAGGLDQSAFINPPTLTSVLRGHIAADGTMGEWTEMTALPVPLATHGSFEWNGYLYVGGGINSTSQESGVWRARVQSNYSLSAWEQVASLPQARGHVHQFPQYRTHVYSIGGALDFNLNSTSHIEVGTFQ